MLITGTMPNHGIHCRRKAVGRAVGTEPRWECRSTRGRGSGPRRPLCTRPANDRFKCVEFLPSVYHERYPHKKYTMRDSFALAQHFLPPLLRSLLFAAAALIGASATYVLYILTRRRFLAYRSSLRNVPGPGDPHWFKGNFSTVSETDSTRLQEDWIRKYGHVLKFQSTLWVRLPSFSVSVYSNTIVWPSADTETPGRGPCCRLLCSTK
jgi:hypothetical protein